MSEAPRTALAATDRRWTAGFALAVMIVTSLPYVLGILAQDSSWQFTGFVFGVDDGNSYIAKMLAGASGAWLFRTPYTPLPQQGVIAFLPYLLLGKLSRSTDHHLQLLLLFHLFRFFAGFLAILATRDFLDLFLAERSLRRWGLALATLGGGLGWSLLLSGRDQWLGSLPLDFYSPETFGFLSIYGLPHLALARALMLWGMLALIRDLAPASLSTSGKAGASAAESPSGNNEVVQKGMKVGILWLGLGLTQPLTLVIAWAVAAFYLVVWFVLAASRVGRKAAARTGPLRTYLLRMTLAGAVSAPVVMYTVWRFRVDPFLRVWTEQNKILSPHPAHYLLAYGVMLPLLILGAQAIWRKADATAWFALSWLMLLPAFAYAPYNLQRRMPEGIWVALVAVSLIGLQHAPLSNRFRGLVLRLMPIAVYPSTILLLIGGIQVVRQPAQPVFRSGDEVAAFNYLSRRAETADVVLAAFSTGNALPAWAPVRVVIGHGPESANLAVLEPQVKAFYRSEASLESRRAWLESLGVRWVFWGPAERGLNGWSPVAAPYLERAFEQGEFAVYKVLPRTEIVAPPFLWHTSINQSTVENARHCCCGWTSGMSACPHEHGSRRR